MVGKKYSTGSLGSSAQTCRKNAGDDLDTLIKRIALEGLAHVKEPTEHLESSHACLVLQFAEALGI